MKLEVIATCVQDARIAEENGADRLELITAVTEGGLTPGIGMIKQVTSSVSIPVHVMVRPHSRTFVYEGCDLDTMAEEIKAIASVGAAGIVIGALTAEGRVDERALERLLPLAEGMNVTFHRAFDELDEQLAALAVLHQYKLINRILTSGGAQPAPQAIGPIRQLVEETRGTTIRILAGHGLSAEGLESFIEQTGVSEVHIGSAVRHNRSSLEAIDPVQLRIVADIVHQISEKSV